MPTLTRISRPMWYPPPTPRTSARRLRLDLGGRHPRAPCPPRADPRHAGAVPARLRRRPRQLAVQPRRRGRSGAGHRARPARATASRPAPAGCQPGRDGRLRRTLLDALEVPRAHVVGHSMGGAIAARLALDHPERVASAVLVNSAGLGPEINAAYIEGFLAAQSRRELKPVVEQLFADRARQPPAARRPAALQAPGRSSAAGPCRCAARAAGWSRRIAGW
jgi:pimeloyl-ACP methyl ester carboxylesterase